MNAEPDDSTFGRFSLAPHQVPPPPQTSVWVHHLRWAIAVMDEDDEDLPFVAGLLSYLLAKDTLTKRQQQAGNIVLDRVVLLWRNHGLACQQSKGLRLVPLQDGQGGEQ